MRLIDAACVAEERVLPRFVVGHGATCRCVDGAGKCRSVAGNIPAVLAKVCDFDWLRGSLVTFVTLQRPIMAKTVAKQ